ncbi:FAD-dependent protein [uncultured Desulfuromonas sp.]|uniref:NAD(P)/FAD-dependent oxidoreductase n=1 Tax=uncultured Desulfuromonas sp. TaxID=181013 RepID=UPI002AAC1C11|nr:FAD-binding protein [uncultured Desulfuromonas sp.]
MATICYQLREVTLSLEEDEEALVTRVAETLGLKKTQLCQWHIVRRGIDARRKGRILRVYTVQFTVDAALEITHGQHCKRLVVVEPTPTVDVFTPAAKAKKVVVVGMGPAGLFAALTLARCGHQVCLVERGRPVEQRVADVENFWAGGPLNPHSNVQFGEGGAGTFSDGKLTTRLKHPLTRTILETLVAFGAPEQILSEAKPHVGTDRLRRVLLNFRKELERLGVELRYTCCVTDLLGAAQKVQGVIFNNHEEFLCDAVVLAVGHSARDTYTWLERRGVAMEPKPFAVGVRVEHPAALINRIQYGIEGHANLPTADYALTYNDRDTGRGVYSFCMCPGGKVVQSSSESESVVVNGMSHYRRAGTLSNSALVVSVRREDFTDASPLAGVRFQQHWERRAFELAGRDYRAPAQNLLTFLGQKGGAVVSSCRPGVVEAPLEQTLPGFVNEGLQRALPHFNRKMRGFITSEATLVGIETRTSAPLRIVRRQDGQSATWPGLYPCGEGAGYAGGIMSAALDGIQQALAVHHSDDHSSTGETCFE